MGKIKRLTIYSDKILWGKKMLLLSDIHTYYGFKNKHLELIKKDISSEFDQLDYIIIPGDIVNDANDLTSEIFKQQLKEELIEFLSGKKTIVSAGNHDQMTLTPSKKWIAQEKELLYETLENIPNLRVLRNGENIEDNKMSFSAFTPNIKYYTEQKEATNIFEEEFFQKYNAGLFHSQNYNVFLTHEPQSIIKLSKLYGECIQPNTDLVVSGHMHNGLLPNMFHPFCKNRGLLSPQLEPFPEFAQGTYQVGDTTFVINGAVNTRVETPIINNLYGYNATIIEIEPANQKIKSARNT